MSRGLPCTTLWSRYGGAQQQPINCQFQLAFANGRESIAFSEVKMFQRIYLFFKKARFMQLLQVLTRVAQDWRLNVKEAVIILHSPQTSSPTNLSASPGLPSVQNALKTVPSVS